MIYNCNCDYKKTNAQQDKISIASF